MAMARYPERSGAIDTDSRRRVADLEQFGAMDAESRRRVVVHTMIPETVRETYNIAHWTDYWARRLHHLSQSNPSRRFSIREYTACCEAVRTPQVRLSE